MWNLTYQFLIFPIFWDIYLRNNLFKSFLLWVLDFKVSCIPLVLLMCKMSLCDGDSIISSKYTNTPFAHECTLLHYFYPWNIILFSWTMGYRMYYGSPKMMWFGLKSTHVIFIETRVLPFKWWLLCLYKWFINVGTSLPLLRGVMYLLGFSRVT